MSKRSAPPAAPPARVTETVTDGGKVYVPAHRSFCPTSDEDRAMQVVPYDPDAPPAELLAVLAARA